MNILLRFLKLQRVKRYLIWSNIENFVFHKNNAFVYSEQIDLLFQTTLVFELLSVFGIRGGREYFLYVIYVI